MWTLIVAMISPIPPVALGWWLTNRKVKEIHVLVNQRFTDSLREVAALRVELLDAGIISTTEKS